MGAIFISYRREDSEGQSGRLFEDLCAHFGDDAVFMDVVGIEPGQDFRAVIETKVAGCTVLLSIIGRHWLSARDAAGQRRIDAENDFVHLETAAALQRGVTVIPVLVQGARMPKAAELPPDLQDLAFRNAVELTHARWSSDLGLLLATLQRLGFTPLDGSAATTTSSSSGSRSGRRQKARFSAAQKAAAVFVGAAVLGGGGWWALERQAAPERQAQAAAQKALEQTLADARNSLAEATAALAQTMALAQAREAEAQQRAQAEQAARLEREAAERELAAAQAQQRENERLRIEAVQRQDAERAAAARRKAEAAKVAAAQQQRQLAEATLRENQARAAASLAAANKAVAAASAEQQLAAAKDAARRLQQGFGTNGLRVSEVHFAQAANGPAIGRFRRMGDRAWVESNAAGQALFRFVETGRDEWSVYLSDRPRGVNIQLDLYTRRVNYSDASKPTPRKQYDVVDAR